MSKNKMKINQNIENYLESYLSKDNTQYATLLTGKWGCGKTYFIKKYIEKHQQYEFIYVSLFGLKNIDDVNDAIFGAMYPKLPSDTTKIATGLIKSAAKIGLQFDLDELNLKDKIMNFLTKNKDKYIFVFDDLERSFIAYDEILGFINDLTENNSIKVILVANVDEIQDDNRAIFDKFKEKVISRTFVVQNDDEVFWKYYSEKYPSLMDFSDEIKDIFQEHSDNNFRLLIQSTDDYLDFVENFYDTVFLKNDEFKKILIKHFLSFCILYKKTNNFDELNNVFFNSKSSYTFYNEFILPEKIWKDILVENKIDIELISEKFGELVIFQAVKERESWVKLWYYWELGLNEFYEVIDDVILKFRNFEYDRADVLQHVYSLLILFIKEDVIKDRITISEVLNIVEQYLVKNINNQTWLNHKFGNSWFNGTGLVLQNQDDEDIVNLIKKINKKIEEQKQYIKEKNFENYLEKILLSIEQKNQKNLYDLLMENEYRPIMNQINHQKIFEILGNNPQSIHLLCGVLNDRYSINHIHNNRTRAKYLIDEKPFIERLIEFLKELNKNKKIDALYLFRIRQDISFLENEILSRFDTTISYR